MIEFKSVSFNYTKKGPEILTDVSFKIEKGELVAIVGKNGAGKTTLLKQINGLLQPKKGEVWINEENIAKQKISKLSTMVGLAFQNPNHQLFAESVQKELEFGPKNLGIDKEERKALAAKLASEFNITHLLEKNPLELSGGERRLVSIASVLTMGQQILVLDEPSFGQDYRQKKRLGNYIKQLSEKEITVLIVSHDINFILEFFPRTIVIDEGKIIADGATFDILSDQKLIDQTDLELPILVDLFNKLTEIGDMEIIGYSEPEILECIIKSLHSTNDLKEVKE